MIRGPLLGLVAAGALVCAPAAGAATFTVGATIDAADVTPGNGVCATSGLGVCTLRAAVQEANALPGGDAIVVPAGTYVLGSTLAVTSRIDLTGSGARDTIIDGPAAGLTVDMNGGGDMTWQRISIVDAARGLGIANAELTLRDAAVRGHGPTTASGAGIRVESTGSLVLVRSTVSGNSVLSSGQALGGGIAVFPGASASVVQSTISGNSATTTGGSSFGGGIGTFDGTTLTVRSSTLVGNSVGAPSGAQYGGNLYRSATGAATVEDSILAGASGSSAADRNCGPHKPTALGRNIDDIDSCGFGGGQLKNTDPQLGSLADNGGPTDTHRVLLTSPARDAALGCDADGIDQRGARAPAGPACDIGAVEAGSDLRTTIEASRASVPAGGDVTYIVRVANAGADPAPTVAVDLVYADGSVPVSVSASQGSCSAAVRCELGTIAPGATGTAVVLARAPATGASALSVGASSALPDPTPADASASLAVPVEAAPGATPPPAPVPPGVVPPGATPPSADRTAPVLGALRLVGKLRRGRTASARTTISENATLSVRVERVTSGRRSGKRCRTGLRRGKRCSIFRLLGTVRATGRAGAVTLRLPARIKKKALALGRHRLTVTATDAAGNRSAVRRLTVTVVR